MAICKRCEIGWRLGCRILSLLLTALAMGALGQAQTLREALAAQDIPTSALAAAELDEGVATATVSDDRYVYLAYLKLRNLPQASNPTLVRMNRESGAVLSLEAPVAAKQKAAEQPAKAAASPSPSAKEKNEKKNECCTSLSALRLVGDYVVATAQTSGDQTAQVVLSRSLKLLELLYGQELIEAAPGLIVSSREGSRWPGLRSERLELAELGGGGAQPLYPIARDRLRQSFEERVGRERPPRESCVASDPCDAALYEETLALLGSNRAGLFAFLANRAADHTASGGGLTSQSALYLYRLGREGWRYCQQEIDGAEADALLDGGAGRDILSLAARCTPELPVTPVSTKAQSSIPGEAPAAPAAP